MTTVLGKRLDSAFYQRSDVVVLAQELLGKVIVTNFPEGLVAGRIVETEAYRAPDDKACHAHLNRFTERTKVMFLAGGHTYIYLCYGIHHLLNIITGSVGEAHAILIRGIEPIIGTDLMLRRRKLAKLGPRIGAGPGVLSQALGVSKQQNATNMLTEETPIWIEDDGFTFREIIAGPRIGIDYAEECADWPWRFYVSGNRFVSKPR